MSADSEEWFDWDEEADVTNKKIVQVTIMESVINTSDVTAAYKVIHEMLYDMDPTMYHNGNFTWFGESEDKLRKAYRSAYGMMNLLRMGRLSGKGTP